MGPFERTKYNDVFVEILYSHFKFTWSAAKRFSSRASQRADFALVFLVWKTVAGQVRQAKPVRAALKAVARSPVMLTFEPAVIAVARSLAMITLHAAPQRRLDPLVQLG